MCIRDRTVVVWRGEKSLLFDPGSEFRLLIGAREKRAKIKNWMKIKLKNVILSTPLFFFLCVVL